MYNTRYRYNHPRRRTMRVSAVAEKDDLLSAIVARLAEHRFLIFVLLLLCMLSLSIACDHFLTRADAEDSLVATQPPVATASAPDNATAAAAFAGSGKKSMLSELLQGGFHDADTNGSWGHGVLTLAFRLTLAALLGAVIAFRPRRFVPLDRNLFIVQTQILLSVVACALMIIVGDSAARAFGIFAAASLVRFRTNISDPKETTILLATLGVGLAAGVGRWELATMFTVFVLVLLQLLERYEQHRIVTSMELSVKTHNVEATDEAVRDLFRRNNLDVDIRALNKESERHPLGKVVYSLAISPRLNTDRLGEQIYLADPVNIDKIEWHRKKAASHA